jgi:hypothetical protein
VIDLPSFAKIEPRAEEENQLQLAEDATPLDGLRAIYTNGKIPLPTRMRAMIEAAPYVRSLPLAQALKVKTLQPCLTKLGNVL